jgi:hypothetical protein
MSSKSVDKLRNSRIAAVIGQVERGEEVDLQKLLLLQTLDIVQSGKDFLADAIEEQRDADERAFAAAKGF